MGKVTFANSKINETISGEGVTVGDYRFKLVVREELTAIRV